MNKKNHLLFCLFLVLLVLTTGCSTMIAPPAGFHEDMPPRIDPKKALSVVYNLSYDELSPYITIYYNVPYSGITFIKEDSLFSASFKLNINIKAEEETIVNKNTNTTLQTKDYTKTISSGESFFGILNEKLSTGNNKILLILADNNSDRRYVWQREISATEIPDTLRKN